MWRISKAEVCYILEVTLLSPPIYRNHHKAQPSPHYPNKAQCLLTPPLTSTPQSMMRTHQPIAVVQQHNKHNPGATVRNKSDVII